MKTFSESLFDQLRKAIESSGETRYRISKESGVSEPTLSRFVAGGGIDPGTMDRIADYLNLRVNVTTPTQRRKSK